MNDWQRADLRSTPRFMPAKSHQTFLTSDYVTTQSRGGTSLYAAQLDASDRERRTLCWMHCRHCTVGMCSVRTLNFACSESSMCYVQWFIIVLNANRIYWWCVSRTTLLGRHLEAGVVQMGCMLTRGRLSRWAASLRLGRGVNWQRKCRKTCRGEDF